jgi:GNAT superfamily N-acetyltransferase
VPLHLEPIALDDPAAVALTTASIAEIDARHAGDPGSGAPPRPEEFVAPDGAFLLARVDGEPAGCGGLARLDGTTGEIRRMYVVPEARRKGIARAILDALLEHARGLGYARVRLETGDKQYEAVALYERAGFEPCPCWGPYVDDPKSRCFELEL